MAFFRFDVACSALVLPLVACAHDTMNVQASASTSGLDRSVWITTWATSEQPDDPSEAFAIDDQTVRQIVRASVGGGRVRVRISNAYGKKSLAIGAAHLALHGRASAIAPGTDRALTFGGATSVHVPPGALLVSDPVSLDVPALGELAISLYFPHEMKTTTVHGVAVQTAYWSAAKGDLTAAPSLTGPTTVSSYDLASVEVEAPSEARTIVALGDSLTDGMKSTPDAHHTWPDFLAVRFAADKGASPRAIVNAGIAGNRVETELVGDAALVRLDRDVLAVPGAAYVIFAEGTNDIAALEPGEEPKPELLTRALSQVIERVHARGMKIMGGTMPPFEGATFLSFTPKTEAARQQVNAWIRNNEAYDGVADFDRVLRDPSHPTRLLPAYDSGDHAHPNDAGYEAMAGAVDMSVFR